MQLEVSQLQHIAQKLAFTPEIVVTLSHGVKKEHFKLGVRVAPLQFRYLE